MKTNYKALLKGNYFTKTNRLSKKILRDMRYDKPFSIYSRFVPFSEFYSSDVPLW